MTLILYPGLFASEAACGDHFRISRWALCMRMRNFISADETLTCLRIGYWRIKKPEGAVRANPDPFGATCSGSRHDTMYNKMSVYMGKRRFFTRSCAVLRRRRARTKASTRSTDKYISESAPLPRPKKTTRVTRADHTQSFGIYGDSAPVDPPIVAHARRKIKGARGSWSQMTMSGIR